MNAHLQELARKPAGEEQIARAREIVGNSRVLSQRLDAFLGENPTRGQMLEFLETLHLEAETVKVRERLDLIFHIAGIEHPTGSDRLMAMQVGLLQEQNTLMKRSLNQMRADAKSKGESDDALFTTIIGSVILGSVVGR